MRGGDDNKKQKCGWTKREDEILTQLVLLNGEGNWSSIALHLKGRVGKQCRERWRNHLNPSICHDQFSQEEDESILHLVSEIGTKWTRMIDHFPGRTENQIKNRYYSSLKQRFPSHQVASVPNNLLPPKPKKIKNKKPFVVPILPLSDENGNEIGNNESDSGNKTNDDNDDEDDEDEWESSEADHEHTQERDQEKIEQLLSKILKSIPQHFIHQSNSLESLQRSDIIDSATNYLISAQERLRQLGGGDDLLPHHTSSLYTDTLTQILPSSLSTTTPTSTATLISTSTPPPTLSHHHHLNNNNNNNNQSNGFWHNVNINDHNLLIQQHLNGLIQNINESNEELEWKNPAFSTFTSHIGSTSTEDLNSRLDEL